MRLAESRTVISICFRYIAAVVYISQEKRRWLQTHFFRKKYQIGKSVAVPIITRPIKLYTTCRIENRDFYLFSIHSSGRLHYTRKAKVASDTFFRKKYQIGKSVAVSII